MAAGVGREEEQPGRRDGKGLVLETLKRRVPRRRGLWIALTVIETVATLLLSLPLLAR